MINAERPRPETSRPSPRTGSGFSLPVLVRPKGKRYEQTSNTGKCLFLGTQSAQLPLCLDSFETGDRSVLMPVGPVEHNVRRCRCVDCKQTLEPGEGIRSKGYFYYRCQKCEALQIADQQKYQEELKVRKNEHHW